MNTVIIPTTHRILFALGAFGTLALAAGPAQAQGGLVLQALNSTASASGTGSFDVTLADLGGTFGVSGFSFELSISEASGITFTAADTNTSNAPYLFGTLQSSPFSFDTFPTTDALASDASMTSPFVTTLTTGSTFGLGHISYKGASGTVLGPITVSLVPEGTSLSDVSGNAIPFTPMNGTITVAPAVPEASTTVSFGLLALGGGSLMIAAKRKKKIVKAAD